MTSAPRARLRACTIVAKNYLASARLLVRTFAEHHPDIPVSVLVVDADPNEIWDGLPFEVLEPGDLPIEADVFGQMATYYDVTELSTAVKPFLLESLLERGDDVVMYLDPDIEVFAPLWDLFDQAAEHQIALTPHVTQPVPRDGLAIEEESFLISGQFNLGFIAVSSAARGFLSYWRERTRLFAVRDPANGYFTDQRWVDAVPTLFEHVVVRDRACNVAYWNLHERSLDVDHAGNWTIDGRALRFFHFSGHDPRDPFRLTRHITLPPRVRVDRQPALRRLLLERAERIRALDPLLGRRPYGWDRTGGGIRLDSALRRLYWEAVKVAERDGVAPPPHAFECGTGKAFAEWLGEAVAPGSPVPRALYARWQQRGDLRAAFPNPLGDDGMRLVDWSLADGGARTMPRMLETMRSAYAEDLPGVNLVGYLDGEFGVGVAARMLARMIRASGLPVASSALYPPEHRHRDSHPKTFSGAPFRLSVLAVNADALLEFAKTQEFDVHRSRPRAGVWYWEVASFPETMRPAATLVDEIWCASEHVRGAIAPWADRPVVKHPLVIDVSPRPPALARSDIGLPDGRFVFGFVFDYASVVRRKNPLGLIRAYRDAFGPDEGAALVLKSMHAERRPEAAAELRDAAGERPDIVFLDGHLDPLEMRALYHLIDCYVSLHRSEGLGLTLATAMAAGTPCIATGYSGNLEFMRPENSVLIPFELVEVGAGADPYPADAPWAEPDLVSAAEAMRKMFDCPDLGERLGAQARADVAEAHNAEDAAKWFVERYGIATRHPVTL